jgi:hypothetical protein
VRGAVGVRGVKYALPIHRRYKYITNGLETVGRRCRHYQEAYRASGEVNADRLLGAFIAFLGSDADLNLLTAGRIAAKHKFAMVEKTVTGKAPAGRRPRKALQLSYDGGGTPDTTAGMERARLEARCYGPSQVEANQVYNRLMALCESFQRTTVATGDGWRSCTIWCPIRPGNTIAILIPMSIWCACFSKPPPITRAFRRLLWQQWHPTVS